MKSPTRIVLAACFALFAAGATLGAQADGAGLDANTETNLNSLCAANDAEGVAKWAAENPALLDQRRPEGLSPLGIALRFKSLKCFSALLDGGADPNGSAVIADNGLTLDSLLPIHFGFSTDLELMRNFSSALISHGYKWDRKITIDRVQYGTAAMFVAAVPETKATIEQLMWLGGQGLDLSRGGVTTADRYISLQEWVKECKKPGFAAAISKAEVAAKALAAAKDAEFARKGRALGKYFGPDSDNVRLLSNPNAFEPGAGYYFHNVLPDKWVMRDKVLCHTENISLRNQVSSDLFLIFIEDPDLRRAFTPWELPIVAGKEMILGYDVILQAYDESVATTWPSFKLVAMRPAKPTMGF